MRKRRGVPLIHGADDKHLDQHQIRSIHLRVCRDAGLKEIRVHDIRHTYASHYVMNGGSLAELQGILGHSTPSMTQKYAHLAPGFLETKAGVVSFSWKQKEAGVISILKHQSKKSDTQVTHLKKKKEDSDFSESSSSLLTTGIESVFGAEGENRTRTSV